MSKLYQRSEYQLEAQGKTLALVRDLLHQRNITLIVSDGTLLGIIREGDFIPWDWDAELFVFYEEVKDIGHQLVEDFYKAGLEVIHKQFKRYNWKIVVEEGGFQVEIRSWFRENGYFKRLDDMGSEYRIPEEFMLHYQTVVLRGEQYLAPLDAEGYLSHVYGNWQTPVKSEQRRYYLNSDFFKPGLVKKSADFVKSILRMK